MSVNKRFYSITISTLEFKTVGNYCSDYNSPAFKFSGKETEFLNIADEDGVTNRQKLVAAYTFQEAATMFMLNDRDLPLKLGILFSIPIDHVERSGILTQGLSVVSNSVVAFKANALAEIESDPTYVSIVKPIKGQINSGIVKEACPEINVWIWCRSLSSDTGEMKGQVFDLTPFVSNLTTNVTRGTGGNFQLSLPPIVCSLDAQGKWQIAKGNIVQYTQNKDTSLAGQGYVSENALYDKDLHRNQFLFHNIISANDIIFIRFETLQLEKKSRFKGDGEFFINPQQIPGKIYDMIGLVDVNGISVNPAVNDVSITIPGRDLSKLFIDDGSYYYTFEQNGQGNGIKGIGQTGSKNGLLERVFSANGLSEFSLWYNQSIEHVFKFVINQLSNIKVCPDDLFQHYDKFSLNKRSTKFTSGDVFKTKSRDQVKKEFNDAAIVAIKQLRLANKLNSSSNKEEDDVVIKIVHDIINFLQDIRDKKVRVIVDTNHTKGWKPFTWLNPNGVNETIEDSSIPEYFEGKLYKSGDYLDNGALPNQNYLDDAFTNIDHYLDVTNSQGQYREQFKEILASGIWQLMKLVIDNGISQRRINDSSLSTASGSILNFFNKMVQSPFVEMILDTYSDIYAVTLRKPPTDQIGIISLLEGKVVTENGRVQRGTPAVADVEAEDVLSENLSSDANEAYSWYHLTPEAAMINNDAYTWSYLPALYFPQYADVYGSKPMDLSHKYMCEIPRDGNPNDLNIAQRQAVYDLKFMIDSNMHNPFTRKGTLVINGDRRIKVGNLLRYKPTGEIFHIDAVQNNFKIGESMIDRTTTVSVSRGMVEQLIYGIPYKNGKNQEIEHISYFNIINTNLNILEKTVIQEETITIPDGYETVQSVETIPDSKYPIFSFETLSANNRGLDKLFQFPQKQQERFRQLITAINQLTYKGLPILVEITSGIRSSTEQQIEYQKNNSKVKNAKPGSSPHEVAGGALAIDINLFTEFGGKKYTFEPLRITKQALPNAWLDTGVPQLAKKLGFLWGGDAFKTYYDPVHFQIVTEKSKSKKIPKTKTVIKNVPVRVIDDAAIFSNFHVNEHVFNFFFRKQQFDKKYLSNTVNRKIYNREVAKALGQ